MGQISSSESKQLFKAAKQGRYEIVADLIGRNASLVATTDWLGGQNVWHIAAINGHLTVMRAVQSALAQGPTGPDHWKPLLRLGHSLQAIMEHVVNQVDSRVRTPLHYACMNGHSDCVTFLLDLGADPWIGDMLGSRTCLHYAAAAGHPECIKAVLSKCAGPNPRGRPERPNRPDTQLVDVRNSAGFAPLHYAVWASHSDAVQALLSFDAYLFPRNIISGCDWIQCSDGCTPLHLAAMKGDVEVAKVLLKAYAECMVLDNAGGLAAPTSRHRTNLPDPRLVLNARNQLAFQIAQRLNNQAMAEILHPSIPFAFLFSTSDFQADTRIFGPCRLAVIAAAALQQKLKQDIAAAAALLQQHDALADTPAPVLNQEKTQSKPLLSHNLGSCDLNTGLDQGCTTPNAIPSSNSPNADLGSTSGSSRHEATEGPAIDDQPPPCTLQSEPVISPFRMDNAGALVMMKSWGGVGADATSLPQPCGQNQVKEVDAQLRVRGSSRRNLLSLGSMERSNHTSATPEEEENEEVPVTDAAEAPSQFSLQDTLPFISGRLGGNKEAFRQQFRLLRLTAGVQQASWQMGQSLLPPQRTRSVPKPLAMFPPTLKRTNTDSPATLRALSFQPESTSATQGSNHTHTVALSPNRHSPGRSTSHTSLGKSELGRGEHSRREFGRDELALGELGRIDLPPLAPSSSTRLAAAAARAAGTASAQRSGATNTRSADAAVDASAGTKQGRAAELSEEALRTSPTRAPTAVPTASTVPTPSTATHGNGIPFGARIAIDSTDSSAADVLAADSAAAGTTAVASVTETAATMTTAVTGATAVVPPVTNAATRHGTIATTPHNETATTQVTAATAADTDTTAIVRTVASAAASTAASTATASTAASTATASTAASTATASTAASTAAASTAASTATASTAAAAQEPITSAFAESVQSSQSRHTPESAVDSLSVDVLTSETVHFDLEDDAEQEEDEDENTCEICMDKPQQLNIPECRHRLCIDCATELCKLHHFRPALCPFCRSIISGFKPVCIA